MHIPYTRKKVLWNRAPDIELLDLSSLIVARDLNLTLDIKEILGDKAKYDFLEPHFRTFFNSLSLRDITPHKLVPTWSNGWTRSACISIILSFDSNHLRILHCWDRKSFHKALPFKFNQSWLVHKDFEEIFYHIWNQPILLQIASYMDIICVKLKSLKREV